MSLFIPPPSRFDLNFMLLGIPVRVHPLFWLMALILAGVGIGLTGLLIWIVAVFISILIHEMGHALAMRRFDQDSYIVLHMLGGLAVPTSSRRSSRWDTSNAGQQIFIAFAGPLAGFIFAALIIALVVALGGEVAVGRIFRIVPLPIARLNLSVAADLVNRVIGAFIYINIFWGVINLMPVFPLDGGRIARELFQLNDPWDGTRKSLQLSIGAGVVIAILGLLLEGSFYLAFLFGILAAQSYQMLRGTGGLF